MQITRIETIRHDQFPNLCWVQVHTDTGLIGLGETFFGPRAVEAYIHESAAPLLLGEDPLRIDYHWRRLYGYVGYRSSGAEMRGNSAIDIALWDLFGKVTGQPVYQLLGGLSRDQIRIYNTCAGYDYGQMARQAVDEWGLPTEEAQPAKGPYEDLAAFLKDAGKLALELREQGITGMKIWPFDPYAEASNGTYISNQDLQIALEPFRKIRQAVGDDMDIMVEFHSLWNLPMAKRICRELEQFQPFWFEDPLKADNLDALADLAATTTVPITISETMSTRWSFREAMAASAAGIVMLDLSWVGGISEAKKIATMAEAHQLPIAPHDCTGPIVLTASTHLSLNAPNALIQETVRAYYAGWYQDIVTTLPTIADGQISLVNAPGLGTELRPEFLASDGISTQRSSLEN